MLPKLIRIHVAPKMQVPMYASAAARMKNDHGINHLFLTGLLQNPQSK